jgi:signal peptidase I
MDPNYVPGIEPTAPTMGNQIIDFIQTLVLFAAIFLVIFLFIAQPHKVSGASMETTFFNADYIITDKLTYRFNEPKRGDVIVFQYPKDHSTDFIKRVIGVPGDKVKVSQGHVFVNDKELDEPYVHGEVTIGDPAFLPDNQEITVPAGEFFALGDNREHSLDSRNWGYVKKSEILGRVLVRYWPPNELGILPGAYAAYNF